MVLVMTGLSGVLFVRALMGRDGGCQGLVSSTQYYVVGGGWSGCGAGR